MSCISFLILYSSSGLSTSVFSNKTNIYNMHKYTISKSTQKSEWSIFHTEAAQLHNQLSLNSVNAQFLRQCPN